MCLTWSMLAALVLAAGLLERVHADGPPLAGVSPRARKVRLRVGERQRFAAPAVGGDARCSWRLDDQTIPGMAPTWDFVPTVAHMGAHRVTLRLDGPAGMVERWWAVRVEPPRPPRVEVASPAAPALEIALDEAVELVLRARPSADGETVRTSWTVDGVLAGEGERLQLTPSREGRVRARALAIGSLGSAIAREWEIDVRPTVLSAATPTTAPARATTSTARTVARTAPPRARPVAPPRTLPPRVASVRPSTAPAPPTPGAEISTSEIEILLQRYAAAWRRHDVEELRRIGEVTSETQAAALWEYFARVADLDVEVQLLEVRPRDDRRTVRFTRRDRFRDPLGRFVSEETSIEKDVARTASGLRFVPPAP